MKSKTSFLGYETVEKLPKTGEEGIVYLMVNGRDGKDRYDEYVWIGDSFEKIGSTDLTVNEAVVDEICS